MNEVDPNDEPKDGGVGRPRPIREHLHRLKNVFAKNPLYFLTCCACQRRQILACDTSARILVSAFRSSREFHGWAIGRYVIMPDHVHFFARPELDGKSLSAFVRDWKKWTARELVRGIGAAAPIWQPEFFDHLLRSADSYAEKWDYVRLNPVRARLALAADDWPYAGECEPLSF